SVFNESDEPLSYAHISIKNRNMGGITDHDGFFNYRIPIIYKLDTVVFSSIGYESIEVPVLTLLEGQDTYIMKYKAKELEGVTIYAPQQLLIQSFNGMNKDVLGDNFFKSTGVYTITSKENESYTLFEQIGFNAYYRGENVHSGIELLAHRRSVDHSLFPPLYSRNLQRLDFGVKSYVLGSGLVQWLDGKMDHLDSNSLEISDILEVDNRKVLVVSELVKGRNQPNQILYKYHIDEGNRSMLKIEEEVIESNVRPNEGYTNSLKYYHHTYENKTIYSFKEFEGSNRINQIERIEKIANIERLSGNLINVHEYRTVISLYNYMSLDAQPEKFEGSLHLPCKLSYDPAAWKQLDQKFRLNIPFEVERDLSKNKPLVNQFEEVDGRLVTDNHLRQETFKRKIGKRTRDIEDIDDFVTRLLNNEYSPDLAPDLKWSDIPSLLKISNSEVMITNFPRNIMGRYYQERCHVGIVAMWLIDSIRKNEGRKPRKAWYISPFPLLEDENDRKYRDSFTFQANILVVNTPEKLLKAHRAFLSWWDKADSMNISKAKRINPLSDTDLVWQGLTR
ncbi:MAG: hypothetical protein RLO12_21290, partial [Fulvivirga sp.]